MFWEAKLSLLHGPLYRRLNFHSSQGLNLLGKISLKTHPSDDVFFAAGIVDELERPRGRVKLALEVEVDFVKASLGIGLDVRLRVLGRGELQEKEKNCPPYKRGLTVSRFFFKPDRALILQHTNGVARYITSTISPNSYAAA